MSATTLAPLTVEPIPDLDDEINRIRALTADIVNQHIIPREPILGGDYPKDQKDGLTYELQQYVKSCGLWAPHLPKEYGGMGLGFLGHAYMNEILAWSPYANAVFGVIAPNSGNASILVKLGTEEQKKQWLEPLIEGDLQSCYCMTEPDAAGSDPRALQTTAVRDGDEWVINGRKWFITNAGNADFAIVMCRTEAGDGNANARMTQIIVPTDTPGFTIERNMPVFGKFDSEHYEITLKNVRVPLSNQLGGRGEGHQAAQDRLAAGRVFHCMNAIGQMWRAFDLMVKRTTERSVHGGKLETKQFMQGYITESYLDIKTARLLTIRCAELLDQGRDARTDISAIKVYVPAALYRVVDRAMQVYGAMGVSADLPLAHMYLEARTLRILDGPDEVHKILVAKNVLNHYHEGKSWDFGK